MSVSLLVRASLQGKQVLEGGIGRASEEEAEIPPATARACLDDPARLLALGLPFLDALQASLGAPLPGLVCLGGFDNVRQEFEWQGVLLELDETRYEWGTLHELECETVRAPPGGLAAWGWPHAPGRHI